PEASPARDGEKPPRSFEAANAESLCRAFSFAILGITPEGTIVDCCQVAQDLFAGPGETLAGCGLSDIFPGWTLCAGLLRVADAAKDGKVVQRIACTLDGRCFPVALTRFFTYGMRRDPSYLVVADLSRLLAQFSGMKRLASAIEQADDAIALTDPAGAF